MTPEKLVRDPVYKQLNDALRGLIRSGEFGRGKRFLSEREIGERFAVSRATANKALSTLVAEGVLTFKKGVGTFVHREQREVWGPLGFEQRAALAGKLPSTRVLVATRIAAADLDGAVVSRLGLAQGEGAFYIERLRLADAEPLILERRYVAARRWPGLLELDLAASLRAHWAAQHGSDLGAAVQALRALAAGDGEAALLEIPPATPCLGVSTLVELAPGAALWWEQALFRGDRCELRAPSLAWSLSAIAPALESRPRRVKQA